MKTTYHSRVSCRGKLPSSLLPSRWWLPSIWPSRCSGFNFSRSCSWEPRGVVKIKNGMWWVRQLQNKANTSWHHIPSFTLGILTNKNCNKCWFNGIVMGFDYKEYVIPQSHKEASSPASEISGWSGLTIRIPLGQPGIQRTTKYLISPLGGLWSIKTSGSSLGLWLGCYKVFTCIWVLVGVYPRNPAWKLGIQHSSVPWSKCNKVDVTLKK